MEGWRKGGNENKRFKEGMAEKLGKKERRKDGKREKKLRWRDEREKITEEERDELADRRKHGQKVERKEGVRNEYEREERVGRRERRFKAQRYRWGGNLEEKVTR